MNDNIKSQKMTSKQFALLAYQTCQWWNAIIIQTKRFLDVLENVHGETSWENTKNIIIAERIFLITAIHHAVENIQKLDVELQRVNDNSFENVLQEFEKVAPINDIKNLRNMNEHSLEYLIGKGFKQDQFYSTIKNNNHKITIAANYTYINGEKKSFY